MSLDAAAERYYNATYVVHAPEGAIRLRLMEPSRELDALLERFGVETWAMVTAWNPGTMTLAPAENDRAAADLDERVRSLNLSTLSAGMIPDGTSVTPEEWIFIAGITPANARELGRFYRQAVIIFGARGGVPLAVRSLGS